MQTDLAAKYSRPAPRYTSYPTAPHFGGGVGPADYKAWLASLPASEPLSLYFHVPYCDTLCWFCGCHTKITRRYQPVASYASALKREIDLVANALGARRPVRHVHWGSGSPTILSGGDFIALMGHLGRRFYLALAREVAVEIDPRGLTTETVDAFASAGMTRASLGVQDFDARVQRAINREQSFQETAQAANWLRGAGIRGINVDLMYGLPHQSAAGVARTADTALALWPDRVALFGYAHMPHLKRHQSRIDEAALPGPQARLEQFRAASERLVAAGFTAIGLDHFARPGDELAVAARERRLHRNFQGYTTDAASALLGFGPSAIGHLPQGFVQNHVPIHAWRDAVTDGRLATARGLALDDDDRLRAHVIERLMCDLFVDVEKECRAFARPPEDLRAAFTALEPLRDDGLVEIDGWRVTVPEAARPFLRLPCAAFDRYLAEAPARASRAI
jgi:oxygen-independent coproporphyrinogen-3 oxidase